MKTVQFIRMSLDMSQHQVMSLIDDMKDAPLTFPTPKGGNHPLWVLGHLAWTEGQIRHVMLGRENPLDSWTPTFGFGSEPTAVASDYPPFDEVKQTYLNLRAESIKLLDSLTDADLDRASECCPPEAKQFAGTYAQCFMVLIVHTMAHHGQVADARRAAGRKRLST
jgi:uncharacterized damage-inducible protein DinB